MCFFGYDREVDFVITENGSPIHFIEAKLSDSDISKGLKYLKSGYLEARATSVHLKDSKNKSYIESISSLI